MHGGSTVCIHDPTALQTHDAQSLKHSYTCSSLEMRMMRTSLPASSAESQKVGESDDIGVRSNTSTWSPDVPAFSYRTRDGEVSRTYHM